MARQFFGFFDSTGGDLREYVADDFAQVLRAFFADGVKELGTNLQVAPSVAGLTTQITPGIAALQGYMYGLYDDGGGPLALTHVEADALPRIDRVVLRLDRVTSARSITPVVLRGTPAASPLPPALTRNGIVWEISLARVAIAAGVDTLYAADITDERADDTVCGVIEPYRVKQYIDQGVKTTDSPTFAGITFGGYLNRGGLYKSSPIWTVLKNSAGSGWWKIFTFTPTIHLSSSVVEISGYSAGQGLAGRGNWRLIFGGDDSGGANYIGAKLAYADGGITASMFDLRFNSGTYTLYFNIPQYTIYALKADCWLYLSTMGFFNIAETPSGTAIPIKDDRQAADGWVQANEIWTYDSTTTINVPTGAASRYSKGDKIRWKQGGAYKYAYIIDFSDTRLAITGGNSYTVANDAITDNYISKIDNPQGFPGTLALGNPTWTTTGAAFTNVPTNGSYYMKIQRNKCIIGGNAICNTVSGGTGSFDATFPSGQLPALANNVPAGKARNSSNLKAGICFMRISNQVRMNLYDGLTLAGNGDTFTFEAEYWY